MFHLAAGKGCRLNRRHRNPRSPIPQAREVAEESWVGSLLQMHAFCLPELRAGGHDLEAKNVVGKRRHGRQVSTRVTYLLNCR